MTTTPTTARAHELLERLDAWAHLGPVRSLLTRALVTVLGPVVVVVGLAMTVLPGPGLVVVGLGLALLAVEYDWARHALRRMGQALSRARDAALPRDGSPSRRALGIAAAGAFAVATFGLTTAVTTYLGTHTIL